MIIGQEILDLKIIILNQETHILDLNTLIQYRVYAIVAKTALILSVDTLTRLIQG